MKISKDIIKQYNDLKSEITELERQKADVENKIEKLLDEGTVKDKVYGGDGGIQGFVVEGFPQMEYDRRRKLLRQKYDRLQSRQTDLMELEEKIEICIDEIDSSRDRQILKQIFLKGMTQEEVANNFYLERSSVAKIIAKYV